MPEERKLSVFERDLTLWVFLCMIVGSLLGRWLPSIPVALDKLSYAQVNLPIAVCLFFMIYPIMVKIDFSNVIKAGRTLKPVGLTFFIN